VLILVSDFSWWFCRYLAEFKSGAERKEAAESTMNAYKAAQVGHLSKTNPIFCVHVDRMSISCILGFIIGVAFCAVGYCPGRSGSNPPHQAWARPQLLGVLLWDPEFPWPRLQPCQAGLLPLPLSPFTVHGMWDRFVCVLDLHCWTVCWAHKRYPSHHFNYWSLRWDFSYLAKYDVKEII